ncbi:dihydrofolate reductase [Salinigranum sp. GCM10025319]|uniref:dihydrofolate reductase n=1 Tax=Salinigranum sp. GCM10025319 TaxID=3252687 RepID=UPI0036108DC3
MSGTTDRPQEDGATETDVRFVLVAAVAANGVIGRDGGMPWHLPSDLRRFKETTTGHPVVMGRRTYDSIAARLDGPLPDRHSVVLSSRDLDLPQGAEVAASVDEARRAAEAAAAEMNVETVYVVGGATVYRQFLPLADGLVLTELHDAYEGDTAFPDYDPRDWIEVDREPHDSFDFVTYEHV